MVEIIGSIVGFNLGASVHGDVGMVTVDFGTVILRNGTRIGYGAASASVSVSHYSTDTFRAFTLDPELADPDINLKRASQSQAHHALTLQLDTDSSLPRGAYEGGLIVLGNVTFKRPAAPKPEKPLGTKERETLLELIAVLCELSGFDLREETKGHAEAAQLKKELEHRNVRLTPQTVAGKIEAGRELIAPKGPTRLEFK